MKQINLLTALIYIYIPPLHVRPGYYEVPLEKQSPMCRCSLNLEKFEETEEKSPT